MSYASSIAWSLSVGCCCDMMVTYGFEVMLSPESPRNFFQFLMTRDLDWDTVEGAIFDFCCGLHPYALKRDPRHFEGFRFLIDGAHWQGQKRLKKADTAGKGGHFGCSSSYNFNVYKPHLGDINSQPREEMHSALEKCSLSLRQKNYENFM